MRYKLKTNVLVYVFLTLLYNPYESSLFQITSFTHLLKAINTAARLEKCISCCTILHLTSLYCMKLKSY